MSNPSGKAHRRNPAPAAAARSRAKHGPVGAIPLCALLLCAATPAMPMERGRTDLGSPFVSGGVGLAEQDTLKAEGAGYALSVLTATRGAGSYLADVRIHITDANSHAVLDTLMDGPWLLVDLPAGRYEVEATRNHRVQRHTISFLARGHVQTVFYFDNHLEDEHFVR